MTREVRVRGRWFASQVLMKAFRNAILLGIFFLVYCQPVAAQTDPRLAWDEVPGFSVTGYAVTIDGVRVD